MKATPTVVAALTVLSFLFGCASKPSIDANRDWSALINSYSFDAALAELGTPWIVGESETGRFAEWILKRRPQFSFGVGVGGGSVGRHSSVGMGAGTTVTPPARGEYLHLDFGTNSLLKAWSRIRH